MVLYEKLDLTNGFYIMRVENLYYLGITLVNAQGDEKSIECPINEAVYKTLRRREAMVFTSEEEINVIDVPFKKEEFMGADEEL